METFDPVELEDWIREMKKIFTVVEVPEKKKVNIGTFYLAGEADIWWSTVKDKLQGPELTWAKFLQGLSAKFYPIIVKQQKEKEFMELKTSGNMTVMQYARNFSELSGFTPGFITTERLKMRKFEEGLAFCIRNQLVGQPI